MKSPLSDPDSASNVETRLFFLPPPRRNGALPSASILSFRREGRRLLGLGLALAVLSLAPSARADVYATNIKLNGATNNVTLRPGGSVNISYILNEPASAGVTIRILSGSTAVRSITLVPGNPGAARGTNTVAWDGKTDGGASLAGGIYAVSIMAAANGYTNWTQITGDATNLVYQCRGLDVNKNTNSFYYGRIFVGNAALGPIDTVPNKLGVQTLNADGSPAEEGVFSDGGHTWAGDGYSPWKLKVGPDDRVYINDWTAQGNVYSWDQQLNTNSIAAVMRDDNNPYPLPPPPAGPIRDRQGTFGGLLVTYNGTNNQVWMADNNTGGWGIARWDAQTNGVLATNLAPTIMVRATAAFYGDTGSDLDDSAFDLDIDKAGNIYVAQQPIDITVSPFKIFRFPPYAGLALSNAVWKTGNTLNVYQNDVTAIAVNPAGTYVAVALAGTAEVLVLDANTGTNVAVVSSNSLPQNAVAWDNAGNLYNAFDGPGGTDGHWRCWSPPGTNQATTIGLEIVLVPQPPQITGIVTNGPNFTISFTGSTNDVASAFTLQSAAAVFGPYNDLTAVASQVGPGQFQFSTPQNGAMQFFRIKR